MMMRILSAIGAALRAAFATIWSLFLVPGRLLSGLFGGPMSAPPDGDTPVVANLKAELAEAQASTDNHAKVARAVRAWCVDAIIADAPVAVPSWLTRDVKDWIGGLSREECERAISADLQGISAHVRGIYTLPGVRKVQPLPAAVWPPAPVSFEPAPVFAMPTATPRPAVR